VCACTRVCWCRRPHFTFIHTYIGPARPCWSERYAHRHEAVPHALPLRPAPTARPVGLTGVDLTLAVGRPVGGVNFNGAGGGVNPRHGTTPTARPVGLTGIDLFVGRPVGGYAAVDVGPLPLSRPRQGTTQTARPVKSAPLN